MSVDSSSWEPGDLWAPCITGRSWRARGEERPPWSPTPTPRWNCCEPNFVREMWCSSRRRTLRGWESWPRRWSPHEADPHRRRYRADGVDPVDPCVDRTLHPAGLRPRDPRGRAAEPPQEAWYPVDGRRRDPGGDLGGLPRHPPGR